MILPNLYSTVNQNQIHVHLHSSDKHVEQYIPSEIKISDIDGGISITTELQAGEASGLVPSCETGDDVKHGLYAGSQEGGVWRPYWQYASLNYISNAQTTNEKDDNQHSIVHIVI